MIEIRSHTLTAADGAPIAYRSLGRGEGVIVVGGVLRSGEDYLLLAAALADEFEVHVLDRRGRGASGPQPADYSIETECADIAALQSHTAARRLFGHSYGGLVVLEAATRLPELAEVAVYEPGVSLDRSIPTSWMPRYEELLRAGDTRGAFACMVRGSGHAPRLLEVMPLGWVKTILRLAIRPAQWQRMEPLLAANLIEHREVARLDGTLAGYGAITAPVLLLGGSKSPPASRQTLDALRAVIPHSTFDVLTGLGHTAPDEQAPDRVAERLKAFFTRTEDPATARPTAAGTT